jgi:HAD superfamily hydrolase (TIGR01490 family)
MHKVESQPAPVSERRVREPRVGSRALSETATLEARPSSLAPELKRFIALQKELRRRLPAHVFEPRTIRLVWLPVHLLVVGFGLLALAQGPGLALSALLSLVMGLSFAGLAFVGHEALHGALAKNARVRYVVGFFGFLPFCLSPRLWIAWHNRVHHAHTNEVGADPDSLSTLEEFEHDPGVRFSTRLQVRTLGLVTLLLGFTGQSAAVLLQAPKRGYLSAAHFRRALLETAFGLALWSSLAFVGGWPLFFWGYFVPLCIGNAMVMAHIVTNHGLSPLASSKDPLETSLSVTVPRWFSFYTLDFGYHVEHHLLPGISHRHGPLVKKLLVELAPERYQSLPLTKALGRYFQLLRIYQNPHTLLDPDTGRTAQTLGPLSSPRARCCGSAPGPSPSLELLEIDTSEPSRPLVLASSRRGQELNAGAGLRAAAFGSLSSPRGESAFGLAAGGTFRHSPEVSDAREPPPKTRRRPALFDMDKTLIAKNSATLYKRYERDLGEVSLFELFDTYAKYFQYFLGIVDADKVASRVIADYRGTSETELVRRCAEWYPRYVQHHVRADGVEAVERHRALGDFLVIVTASTSYATAPLAAQLKMDFVVATELELDARGTLTGEFVRPLCYGPGKLERVRKFLGANSLALEDAAFYTDSITDLPLLEAVAEPYVVNPDPRLRREAKARGWPILMWK